MAAEGKNDNIHKVQSNYYPFRPVIVNSDHKERSLNLGPAIRQHAATSVS